MIKLLFLSALLLLMPATVIADEISTTDILAMPIEDRTCHNYCVVGFCVWLKCTPFGCKVRTTARIRHHNPDLIVSIYDEIGGNPWTEANAIYSSLEQELTEGLVGLFHDAEAGVGHRTEGGSPYTDHSLRYHEAAAIGHPMSILGDFLSNTDYFCPSEATPFYPYFLSAADSLSWRLGLPDRLHLINLLPGIRVIGEGGFFQQWGPLWPRTGFVNQKDYAKGAAVVAQRVGNIVTRTGQPHIYTALNGNNYNRTWLPGELIENRIDTGRWQMLSPKMDEQCYVFGENDIHKSAWSLDRQSENNQYVYTLWRPYDCCRARGALIATVDSWRLCL